MFTDSGIGAGNFKRPVLSLSKGRREPVCLKADKQLFIAILSLLSLFRFLF
jgi:hypothetical protein